MPVPNTNRYDDIVGTGITLITTRNGELFMIDTTDRAKAARHCWSLHEHGYARAVTRINGRLKTVYLHRLLCETSPEMPHVDHASGQPFDCRSANLRACNRQQNLRNQKLRINNSSGFKGVDLHKQTGRFRARVGGGGHKEYLGLFDTPEAAFAATVQARERRHKEFARHA